MSGLVASDLEALPFGQGSRSIVGESTLNVNFDTRQVTGRATNFWEVVGGSRNGQIEITDWVQGLSGTLNQTGVVSHIPGSSAIILDTAGNLVGQLDVNGTPVSGTFSVVADGNVLLFYQKGSRIVAIGDGFDDGYSELDVTFTPTGGGASIPICYNNSCPASGAGLTVGHNLELN